MKGLDYLAGDEDSRNLRLYNGKELQTDFDLSWYDFGNRMQDPQLGRFHTMDRFAEKYYSMTPYQYGGNNPVLFIDVNGDSLYIKTLFRKLKYDGGKLYKKNGQEFSGKRRGYVKKTYNALRTIGSKTEGSALVGELENSNFDFVIKRGHGKNNFTPDNRGHAQIVTATGGAYLGISGSGGVIKWSPHTQNGGLNQAGSTERPSFISLGHEMGHGQQSGRGTANYSVAMPGFNFSLDENSALHTENLLRAEHNIPLRTHYGYNSTTGAGIYPALTPGTSTSAFTPGFDYNKNATKNATIKRILSPRFNPATFGL